MILSAAAAARVLEQVQCGPVGECPTSVLTGQSGMITLAWGHLTLSYRGYRLLLAGEDDTRFTINCMLTISVLV